MSKYCYVYVLRSTSDQQFYVGLTRDLYKRLQAHHNGLVNSTKHRRPFELVYWEGCASTSDASRREKYLKTAWASDSSKHE
jgi:putative endonuclease